MKIVSEHNTCEGLVIRTFPYGESDLIVRLLTPSHGKLAAIAKFARKSKNRFAGRLDLFERGDFELRGDPHNDQKLLVLQSMSGKRSFPTLRSSLLKLTLASVLCESFDLLTIPQHVDPSADLYHAAKLSLTALDEAQDDTGSFRACYLGLAMLMTRSGFLDSEISPPPSAKALMDLISDIEKHSEKELVTKPALSKAILDFKKIVRVNG